MLYYFAFQSTFKSEIQMSNFVNKDSIVRKIWGTSDTILFIFAGASAEFALNKSVDWLYFTGKLPADPLGRLFSTVAYAREIVFSELDHANRSIDKIAAIHQSVEQARGAQIPAWAYRDVLFMLIDYSIKSFELLERKLSEQEKEEVFDVFNRVGLRMNIPDLPTSYRDWLRQRNEHIHENLAKGRLTDDLYLQYKKHLGYTRFMLLWQVQKLIVPERVGRLLGFHKSNVLLPFIEGYKFSRRFSWGRAFRNLLMPSQYQAQINRMNVA
jgi:hypothetical protein